MTVEPFTIERRAILLTDYERQLLRDLIFAKVAQLTAEREALIKRTPTGPRRALIARARTAADDLRDIAALLE